MNSRVFLIFLLRVVIATATGAAIYFGWPLLTKIPPLVIVSTILGLLVGGFFPINIGYKNDEPPPIPPPAGLEEVLEEEVEDES